MYRDLDRVKNTLDRLFVIFYGLDCLILFLILVTDLSTGPIGVIAPWYLGLMWVFGSMCGYLATFVFENSFASKCYWA